MSVELKPHSQFDFINHDKVFCQNNDNTTSYFELYYEEELGAWMLIPYEDKTFSKQLKREDGKVISEFLYEYGYDLLERCEDYDFDELD
jgi:hypothetical protein